MLLRCSATPRGARSHSPQPASDANQAISETPIRTSHTSFAERELDDEEVQPLYATANALKEIREHCHRCALILVQWGTHSKKTG